MTRTNARGRPFARPQKSIGALDTGDVARLISVAADIVLVLDRDGVILDIALRSQELHSELRGASSWSGRSWLDTITVESRPKATALLEAALQDQEPQLRHLNHMASRGADIAVEYCAVRSNSDRVVLFGRDLRSVSMLQQRLVDAQMALERDYAELRHTETRYRMLFDQAPEPLFVLDAKTSRIREANPSARRLAGAATQPGVNFADGLNPRSRLAFIRFLAAIRQTGRADPFRVTLLPSKGAPASQEVLLGASLLVEEETELVLMRVVSDATAAGEQDHDTDRRFLSAVNQSPDGFVFADAEGGVLGSNNTFLEMIELASIDGARGRSIDNWLGASGIDFDVLFANLRQRGIVRLFPTRIRGERRRVTEVEVSAVALVGDERPTYGFAIRDVSRRVAAPAASDTRDLPRSVEQMSELIGRVPLKDLVRDATDVIERLSIEAALELTNDNRASAAEMLGLSRQSLYVKLRRYGLGDLGEADPE